VGRRLILDTTELIEIERGNARLEPDDDVGIAAVSLAELEVGAYRTTDPEKAERIHQFVTELPNKVTVLQYTRITAHQHAILLAHVANLGAPRGAHDLIIAAHARETGREVLSADNKARFEDLPGVSVA
jgi:tRNA(fMet)-specific endonuclease VapC